jgi:hypothetical protein
MVAAMRNGDGVAAVVFAKYKMSDRRALESTTSTASKGTTFFSSVIIVCIGFLFKRVLVKSS